VSGGGGVVKGETALHVACRRGLVRLTGALLEAGANANVQTLSSWVHTVSRQTPLHVAVEGGHKDVVQLFLDFKGEYLAYLLIALLH